MIVNGPIINKTFIVPEHTVERLDLDAYWNLDYQGNLAADTDEPMLLYAKVAWPNVGDAQRQFRLEEQARAAEAAEARRKTALARKAERETRQAIAARYRAEKEAQ